MHTRQYLKILGAWAMFLALHYAYDYAPILPIKLISGTNESNFQHWKIAFFSYLLVSVIEYFIRRRHIKAISRFVFSRLFGTVLIPWLVFIFWYIAPACVGCFESVVLEVVYANIVLVLCLLCTVILEQEIAPVAHTLPFKLVISAMFLILCFEFIVFTFRLPWADIFADPTLIEP